MLGIIAYLMIDICIDFAVLNMMFCDVMHGQKVNLGSILVIWGLTVFYINCCRQGSSVCVYRNDSVDWNVLIVSHVTVKKKKGSGTCQEAIYDNSNNVQPRSFVSCLTHISNGGCPRTHWEPWLRNSLIVPFLSKDNPELPPKLWQYWHTQQYHMAAISICCGTRTGLPFLLVTH